MKNRVILLSFIIILALAAPAEAYSFQDAIEDFTGFFNNLITGLASGNLCGENEDVCMRGLNCNEGYIETTGTGCPVGPDPSVCCREIICGDGYRDGLEKCDEGIGNGEECVPESDSKCDYCSTNCKFITLGGAYCGDGKCNPEYESEETCSEDCGTSGGSCGDGICTILENCSSCKEDCYTQSMAELSNTVVLPHCGDSLCNGLETCISCEDCWNEQADCENDQICSQGECIIQGAIPESCGDGQLEEGEDCEFDSDCELNQTCSYQCECISFEPILVDCDNNTFSNSDCVNTIYDGCVEGNNTWLGDNYCDDGEDGLNLNCEIWTFDGGDCTSDIMDCDGNIVSMYQYENWLGDGECDYGQYGINFNCTDYDSDNGDCLSHEGRCLEGELEDCNGICYNLNTINNNLGNNICDWDEQGATSQVVLNCGEWAHDGGDCNCIINSDCPSILSNEAECNMGNCEYTDCNKIIIINNECTSNQFPNLNSNENRSQSQGIGDITGNLIKNKAIKQSRISCNGCNPYEEGFYDGCIYGERTLLYDGECTERLNCEAWSFDSGECNSNSEGGNSIINLEEIILEFGEYTLSDFDLNMNPEFILNQIISLSYLENVETNKIFSYNIKLKQGNEKDFKLLLANPLNYKEDYVIKEKTLFSTKNRFKGIMNIYENFNHSIILDKTKEGVLYLEVHSDPIVFSLGLGEEKEIDINKDGLIDVSLQYNSLNKDGTVNIRVTYLKLNTRVLSEESFISLNPNIKQEIEEPLYSPNNMVKLSGLTILIILLFMIIFIRPRKKKKR
jgi:hypothetical protein